MLYCADTSSLVHYSTVLDSTVAHNEKEAKCSQKKVESGVDPSTLFDTEVGVGGGWTCREVNELEALERLLSPSTQCGDGVGE